MSKDALTVGAASVAYNGVTTGGTYAYYVQGQSQGTTTVTVSAPGYTSVTNTVTVNAAGFFISSDNFTTFTFSDPRNVQINVRILNADHTLSNIAGLINPEFRPLTVNLTSSNTAVGTTTAATFNTDVYGYASFAPAGAAGTSTLSLVTPAGFTTPVGTSQFGTVATESITATVTAPAIGDASTTSAVHGQVQAYTSLSTSPPSARAVTLTVGNTAIARISTSNTAVGTGSITFNNVENSNALSFWVQGQTQGSTTLTISAPGYATQTSTLTVNPSGFYLSSGDYSTSLYSGTSSPQLTFAALAPGTLNPGFFPQLNPDVAPVSVTVTSSNNNVGTISSPFSFPMVGGSQQLTFTPQGWGRPS